MFRLSSKATGDATAATATAYQCPLELIVGCFENLADHQVVVSVRYRSSEVVVREVKPGEFVACVYRLREAAVEVVSVQQQLPQPPKCFEVNARDVPNQPVVAQVELGHVAVLKGDSNGVFCLLAEALVVPA